MSSVTETAKNKAEDLPSEEQASKKLKVDDSSDNNNQTTTASSQQQQNNNNNGNRPDQDAVPSKQAVNGGDSNDAVTTLSNARHDVGEEDDDDDVNGGPDDGDGEQEDGVPRQDDETGDGANTGFDPAISKSLEQVEDIQMEICGLNEKASEEILKVEQKFNKLRRPHFEKRDELLKTIPHFWLTALANHPIVAPMIESAEDEDCLKYLISLDVEEFEDIKSGYKLTLQFRDNPYFTNRDIVKEFQILNSEEAVSTSTPIEFKNTSQGKRLKQVVDESIAQSKRVRRPGQMQQSFFAWLIESAESGVDEISDIIKDQIWPNPLQFFFIAPEDYDVTDEESDDDEEEEIDDDGEELEDSSLPFDDYLQAEGDEDDDGEDDEDDEEDEEEDAE